MKLVFGSSPLRGDVTANVKFAERCARYIVAEGHSPCMPHLFFTRFLDDGVDAERASGIACGLKWLEKSDEAWFFADGEDKCSEGMRTELAEARRIGVPVRFVSPSAI